MVVREKNETENLERRKGKWYFFKKIASRIF